jgi:N-acyl amino acid synthase of PEP-CTERM/exosortase system
VAFDGMTDFAACYDRYFAVMRADTPELLDLAYRLRYQVYCVENQFEDAVRFLDGRETDEDDDRSVHTLLVHRQSDALAGTARLILPSLGDKRRQLPIQGALSSRNRRLFEHLPLERTAEISRFAVSKEFRRRQGEDRHADTGFCHAPDWPASSERRLLPRLTFGLIRGILGICLDYQVAELAAMMEPALIRILRRLGLHFEPIGGLVEHHGIRQPCVARLADLIERSREGFTLLWQYTGEDIVGREADPLRRARQSTDDRSGRPHADQAPANAARRCGRSEPIARSGRLPAPQAPDVVDRRLAESQVRSYLDC